MEGGKQPGGLGLKMFPDPRARSRLIAVSWIITKVSPVLPRIRIRKLKRPSALSLPGDSPDKLSDPDRNHTLAELAHSGSNG